MISYKTRPGIILAEVCGQYLLVAAKEARQFCPYTTQINETSAFLWNQMREWTTFTDLMESVSEEYEIDDSEEAAESVLSILKEMVKLGYLMTEEERDE